MQKRYHCNDCGDELGEIACSSKYGGSYCSVTCAENAEEKIKEKKGKPHDKVTAPPHYHKYAIDTIGMLRDGFPPEVLRGFLIGNIYKYIQRYQLKNGNEDLRKAMRYMELLMEEEVKNHSK